MSVAGNIVTLTGMAVVPSATNSGFGTAELLSGLLNPPPTFGSPNPVGPLALASPQTVTAYETKLAPAILSGVLTLDVSKATVFDVTMSGNITSLLFTNLPITGIVYSCTLILTYTGSVYTASWPASFKWPYSSPPALTSTSGKQDAFVLLTRDAGTTWLAFISGQSL